MIDNKSDVDSPTPFATGSTSLAETSTAAAGSVGHNTSSEHAHHHHHQRADDAEAAVPAGEQVTGEMGTKAPSASQQAADRDPAEGAAMDDTMREATGVSASGDMVEQTGTAGFSPGSEGGLGSGDAPAEAPQPEQL